MKLPVPDGLAIDPVTREPAKDAEIERLRTEVYVAKAGKAGDRLPPPRGHKGDAAKAGPAAPLEETPAADAKVASLASLAAGASRRRP